MSFPHRLFSLAAVGLVPLLAAAQQTPTTSLALSAPMPVDTAVRRGVLPNGLHYLIRRNGKPAKRAELRLVVRAGSILEDEDQRGLAHYVEHMAFNGTQHFPKQAIVSFLEKAGMRFGADLNAYTGFDETVYMLEIPTDTAALLATALDVMHEWASAITFDSTEFAKERGVVIEEWRTGRGADQRVRDRQMAVQFKGSRYADRLPIGSQESLHAAQRDAAVRFYREWYRPELMTVIAVGDFDSAAMERDITSRFAALRNPSNGRPRTWYDIPGHAETRVVVATDKEFPQSVAEVTWMLPRRPHDTVGAWRAALVADLYTGMLGQRLGELSQRGSTPFAFAFAGRSSLTPTRDAFTAAAVVKENRFTESLEAVLGELERANRLGFSATEFDRQKVGYTRAVERAVSEADKAESRSLADELLGFALDQGTIESPAQLQGLVRAYLDGITLAEVNAAARDWMPTGNRFVAVAAPARADLVTPGDSALLAVFDRVRQAQVVAYVDSAANAPLVGTPPTPGAVRRVKTITDLGITEWTLANGIRVLLKPTDFKNDEVLLSGRRPGGLSRLDNADYHVVSLSRFVLGGAGAFSENQLRRMLTGKVANADVSAGDYGDSAFGRASPKDLETMFQLLWLHATQPRLDTALFTAYRGMMKAAMQNSRNTPAQAFGDTMTVVMANYNPRVRLFQPEQLDSLDASRAFALYRARFADFAGWTFYLVGNFTLDGIKPLVERYLGSLPAHGKPTTYVDRGIRPPAGVVTRVVRKGTDPKADTRIKFYGPFAYSYANRVEFDALLAVLEMRLRDVLREDKSGTYGVSVNGWGFSIPYQRYSLSLDFESAPERVDELVGVAFAVLDSLKRLGPTAEELQKVKERFVRAHETALRQNGSWLDWMRDHDEDGRDLHVIQRYPAMVQALTAAQLKAAAQRYLNTKQYARFTLLPETTKPAP